MSEPYVRPVMAGASPAGHRVQLRRRAGALRALAIGAPLLLQLLLLIWMPRDAFWVTDEGNRFIQLQSLVRGRVEPPAVEYPGRALDPDLRFLPDGGVHFLRRGGTVIPYYPPYLPWLVAPLYRQLGSWGLWILPLAAAAGSLVVFGLLLEELEVDHWRWVGVLALGLGSPVLFYGLTFWEHTLSLLLTLGGLTLVLTAQRRKDMRQMVLAGVLLGLATVLREEGYPVLVAVIAAELIVWRRLRPALATAAGWSVVMAPLWAFQQRVFGSWLGFHAGVYERMAGPEAVLGRVLDEAQDAWFYLARLHPNPWVGGVLVLPIVLILAGPRRWRAAALWAAVAASAIATGLAVLRPDQLAATLDTQVLLLHVPLLIVVLATAGPLCRSGAPARFALVAVTVFSVIAVVPLHRQDVGVIWGPRHFLAVIPLILGLAMLAAERVHGRLQERQLRGVAVVLVVVSVALQLSGMRTLALKKQASSRLMQTLQQSGDVPVVSDAFWLAEDAAVQYYRRPFFFVYGDTDLVQLAARLRRAGFARFVVVLGDRYRTLSLRLREDLRRQALSDWKLRPGWTELMGADVLLVPLSPLGSARGGQGSIRGGLRSRSSEVP